MSKEMTIILLGVWVAIVPYLGVPGVWRTALLLISGVAIAIVGFLLRGESIGRAHTRGARSTFAETVAPPAQTEHHEHQEGTPRLN